VARARRLSRAQTCRIAASREVRWGSAFGRRQGLRDKLDPRSQSGKPSRYRDQPGRRQADTHRQGLGEIRGRRYSSPRLRLGLAGSRPSYSVFPMSGMTIRSIRLHRHWLGSRKEHRAMGRQLVRLWFVFTTHIGRRSRIIATFPGNGWIWGLSLKALRDTSTAMLDRCKDDRQDLSYEEEDLVCPVTV